MFDSTFKSGNKLYTKAVSAVNGGENQFMFAAVTFCGQERIDLCIEDMF